MKEFFKPNAKKVIIFLILTLVLVALWMSPLASFLLYPVIYLVSYPLMATRGGGFDAQSNDPYIVIPLILFEWLVLLYPLSCLIYHYYSKAKKTV